MNLDQLWKMSYDSKTIDILRNSSLGIPVIQSFHLFGITLLLGSMVALNLRLLGIGLTEISLKVLARHAARWGSAGLILAMVSGFLVFLPDPARYAANHSFQFKMIMLPVAALFQYTLYRRTVFHQVQSPVKRRFVLVPLLSLTLWFSVGWAGRAIAFLG
jgi:uncharacterized protein DUF6644